MVGVRWEKYGVHVYNVPSVKHVSSTSVSGELKKAIYMYVFCAL